jgi:hypothetical protein
MFTVILYRRGRARWLIGMMLVLVAFGGVVAVRAYQRASPAHVPIEALERSPDGKVAYIDRYIEVEGRYGFIGMDECKPGTLALLSFNESSRIWMRSPLSLDRKSSLPIRVRGWLRWYNPTVCGHSNLYLEVEEIEFLK